MIVPRSFVVLLLVAILASAAPAAPADGDAGLRRAFAAFITAKDLRFDTVPDIYPGGYARISIFAKRADLGGMVVDEAWFRLTGVSLDPEALGRGELRVVDVRETAMHVKASINSLEEYFRHGDGVKDVKLWSDGDHLFGRGTVPLGGMAARVFFKGFFAVGGTKDVYFYINDLRLNGLPVLTPLIRKWEQDINPVFSQSLWPITFKIRALRMTKDWFVISSQADPSAPCLFCGGGDAPAVAP